MLPQHVAEVLSNRSKLRRQLLGLRDFLKTPVGILVGIYGFLVVFWGAAIVLFLLKWINLHDANKQGLWVEISSQVVNALFTITGLYLRYDYESVLTCIAQALVSFHGEPWTPSGLVGYYTTNVLSDVVG